MSVQQVGSMMKPLLLLVLVLQSKSRYSTELVPKPQIDCLPPLDITLLTIKKEILENDSEFTLTIRRRSPKLKLDLPFNEPLSKSKNHRALLSTCDMPQLEILAGDQLLYVNGIRSPKWKTLRRYLDTAFVVDLTLRRNPGMGRPPPSEQLGTYQQPPEEQPAAPTEDREVVGEVVGEVCAPHPFWCTSDSR